jgi:hypothetical protein
MTVGQRWKKVFLLGTQERTDILNHSHSENILLRIMKT